MAAVTGGTDREEVPTLTTRLLTKGWIHGVGASAEHSDWTSRPNRGTTIETGSKVGARDGHEGPATPGPSPDLPQGVPYPNDRTPSTAGAVDAAAAMDARVHKRLGKPLRGFPQILHAGGEEGRLLVTCTPSA